MRETRLLPDWAPASYPPPHRVVARSANGARGWRTRRSAGAFGRPDASLGSLVVCLLWQHMRARARVRAAPSGTHWRQAADAGCLPEQCTVAGRMLAHEREPRRSHPKQLVNGLPFSTKKSGSRGSAAVDLDNDVDAAEERGPRARYSGAGSWRKALSRAAAPRRARAIRARSEWG
jgi:hypothetical protein